MRRLQFAIALVVVLGLADISRAQKPLPPPVGPVIVLETVKGPIEIELFQTDAPKSVAHIIALVKNGFYRGLRFHWVLPGVVQVGDPTSRDMSRSDSWGSAGSGRSIGVAEISKRRFERGIVGLAYRADTQKATAADSQIFILRAPNPALDGKYAAIGRVIQGMNVVDKIEKADMIKMASVK